MLTTTASGTPGDAHASPSEPVCADQVHVPDAVGCGTGRAVTLKFGGRTYKSADWSFAGCCIPAKPSQFQFKQQIAGHIQLAGADGRGEFVAEVMGVDDDGHLALRWLEMSPHIFVAMHGLA